VSEPLKILEANLKHGEIVVVPESFDDLWHLFNIIMPGDLVFAKTVRSISRRNSIRRKRGERVVVYLGIKVEDVKFHEYSTRLRIKGKIVEGPEDLVPMGAYHTINVEPGTTLKIVKDEWPEYMLRRLNEAVRAVQRPQVVIVAVDESEATIGVISDRGVTVTHTLSSNVSGKSYDVEGYEYELRKFFERITEVLKEVVERIGHKDLPLVIVGPGFVKDRLKEYIEKKGNIQTKGIITDTTSSASESALYEAIKRGVISKILSDMHILQESKIMEEFLRRIAKNEQNIAYGIDEVSECAKIGAIQELLISENLIRALGTENRQKIDELLRNVETSKGNIIICSEKSPVARQLKSFGDVIALLRYPVPLIRRENEENVENE